MRIIDFDTAKRTAYSQTVMWLENLSKSISHKAYQTKLFYPIIAQSDVLFQAT
jgi:hypothetical protein